VRKKYDVVVIGAGISGCLTALGLQKAGFKVLLLEKNKEVGCPFKKIDVTEEIGLDNIMRKYKIKPLLKTNVSFWHAGKECFKYKSRIADLYFLRGRVENSLERQLFRQAIDAGSEIIFSANVQIKGKEIKVGKNRVLPKVIVGADGTDSMVTNYCFPDEKRKIIEGYGESYKSLDIPIGETHIFFDQTHLPGGYVYLCRSPSLATVVLGGRKGADSVRLKLLRKVNPELNQMIGERTGTKIKGKGVLSNLNNRVYKNIILVGDAARVSDPLFLYGVRPALISGDCAVEAIVNYFEEGHSLGYYNTFLENKILKTYRLARICRHIFEKLNQKEIETVIREAGRVNDVFGLDSVFMGYLNVVKIFLFLLREDFIEIFKLGVKIMKVLLDKRDS